MKSHDPAKRPTTDVLLIASDDDAPSIRIRPGTRFEAVAVPIVTPKIVEPVEIGARLCGGSSTCLALIDIGTESRPPFTELPGRDSQQAG